MNAESMNISDYIDKISDCLSLISDLISEYAEYDQETLRSIPRLHESVEKIFIDFNHVVDSLIFNTNQIIKLLQKKNQYSKELLDKSNFNLVNLAGRYAGARNSFAWLKDIDKKKRAELDSIYTNIKELIFKFDSAVIEYNEGLDDENKLYNLNKAYQIWKEQALKNNFYDDQL